MADEFQLGSGNWWDSTSSRNRFDSGSTPGLAAASTSVNSSNMGSFGWPTEMVASRSCMDSSVSASGSSMVFPAVDHSTQKLQAHQSSSSAGDDGGLLPDPNLQMMGLALSSQTMDWNQAALL